MRRVFLRALSLAVVLALPAPDVLAAPAHGSGKTIKDLSDAIPLRVLERSAGVKFYQSLLISPLEDWSLVRAQVTGHDLRDARIIRPSVNPAYNSLAVRWANELTLVANDRRQNGRQPDFALMHLFIYKIANGFLAVSFAYSDGTAAEQNTKLGTVRLSVKKTGGPWTELTPSERQDARSSLHERGRRVRRMDRMPMDVITSPMR